MAGEEQGDWHVGQLPAGGLVAAAAGVGARLAGGEVFGSHAGRVLWETGKRCEQGMGWPGKALGSQPEAPLGQAGQTRTA